MSNQNQPIHVAIAFDQNYIHCAYALLSSLKINHSEDSLAVHLIASGVSEQIRKEMNEYMASSGQVFFYDADTSLIGNFVVGGKWTTAVYYRLLFPLMIATNIDRLIYLDSDMIVIKSLRELYTIELDHFPLGAVYDNYVKMQPLIGIDTEGEYFNSGMLMIDLAKWREQKISEQAMNYLSQYPERIQFVDQCALNAVLKNNWKKLDNRFNLIYSYLPESTSMESLTLFIRDKIVIHYTLQRPWNMLCRSRLRYLYFYYLGKYPAGRQFKKYTDFSITKVLPWMRIRISEFYFDHRFLKEVWKLISSSK
jgi:lipopolysaccharide biosynthesis glycosyltransferase